MDEKSILAAFDRALHASTLSDTDRLLFSTRKMQFLEDLGTDVNA